MRSISLQFQKHGARLSKFAIYVLTCGSHISEDIIIPLTKIIKQRRTSAYDFLSFLPRNVRVFN